MITVRITLLLIPVAGVVGCTVDQVVPADEPIVAEVAIVNPDGTLDLRGVPGEPDLSAGRWENKDGAMICHGYLTRFKSEDFCAAEVPDDWIPFTFDGQTYYIQPLSGI